MPTAVDPEIHKISIYCFMEMHLALETEADALGIFIFYYLFCSSKEKMLLA